MGAPADEPSVKRMRIDDAGMGELVEYGHDDDARPDRKATTRVHVLRRDDFARGTQGTNEDEARIDDDCRRRTCEGKYYVKVVVTQPVREPHDRSRLTGLRGPTL